MSQVCELTGKKPSYGNKVSHSNIKTRTRWMPNLRKKKYEIPELKQTIAVLISTRGIRTIDKLGGITPAIMKAADSVLSERLVAVKNKIYRGRVKRTAAGKAADAAPKATKASKATAKVAKAAAAEKTPAKAASSATAVKAPKAPKVAKAPKAAKAEKAPKAEKAAKAPKAKKE
ncbi:MAG: 50S ribosomal protein L28 [Proteobacteria bacterium]|nr:MAG: 50S ribosomal protein L28 [Pseudomonadota bacterium]